MVRVWVHSTAADIVLNSETWSRQSIHDNEIYINGFHVFCADRAKKVVELFYILNPQYMLVVIQSV